MRETDNVHRRDIRWQLLVEVSAGELLASAYGAETADSDSDRPVLWIELGGQLDSLGSPQEKFSPPFMASITQANQLSTLNVQQQPAFAFDAQGKISLQPDGSDWVFSASVQYGRSAANKHHHQQTNNQIIPVHYTFPKYKNDSLYPIHHVKFADGQSRLTERHTLLEFEVGKDVGLGMFGIRGSSVVSAGVRIAQLQSGSQVDLRAEPDVHYTPAAPITSRAAFQAFKTQNILFHDYHGSATFERDFHGIGPSLSWNASAPVVGNDDSGELALDWGLKGAVLFGRQTVRGRHQTTSKAYALNQLYSGFRVGQIREINFGNTAFQCGSGLAGLPCPPTSTSRTSKDIRRSRGVTVPDLGASIGMSYRYRDAKINFGYQAEILFGVIDGGIDAPKSENRIYNGPFASVSIGLGG